jgi:hypothetical protein
MRGTASAETKINGPEALVPILPKPDHIRITGGLRPDPIGGWPPAGPVSGNKPQRSPEPV